MKLKKTHILGQVVKQRDYSWNRPGRPMGQDTIPAMEQPQPTTTTSTIES